jgi:hypothetical protein
MKRLPTIEQHARKAGMIDYLNTPTLIILGLPTS